MKENSEKLGEYDAKGANNFKLVFRWPNKRFKISEGKRWCKLHEHKNGAIFAFQHRPTATCDPYFKRQK